MSKGSKYIEFMMTPEQPPTPKWVSALLTTVLVLAGGAAASALVVTVILLIGTAMGAEPVHFTW